MRHSWKNLFGREALVVFSLLLAGAVWYVFLLWIAPYLYEMLSRHCFLDYSYLWDGVSDKVRRSSLLGPLVVAGFYVILQLSRLLKCVSDVICGRGRKHDSIGSGSLVFDGKTPIWWVSELVIREIVIALAIVILSCTAVYMSRSRYMELREQYFSEVVGKSLGFQSLSSAEKLKARDQYERIHSSEPVAGMLQDYGFRAQFPFYAQHVSFWLLIWGYPVFLVSRTAFWVTHILRK